MKTRYNLEIQPDPYLEGQYIITVKEDQWNTSFCIDDNNSVRTLFNRIKDAALDKTKD